MQLMFRVAVALGGAALTLFAQQPMMHPGIIPKPALAASSIPVVFEPNLGQAAPDVRFVSRFGASTLLLSKRDARLLVTAPLHKRPKAWMRELPRPFESSTVRLTFPGAAPDPAVEGIQPLAGRTNYFLGSAKPFSVSQYQRVGYRSLYPGVDLIYHSGNGGRLEHDFVVEPGGDPALVRLAFPGSKVSVAANGDLMVRSGPALVIEKRPVIYQETAVGRKEIAGGYRRLARGEYGFHIGSYDRSLPLVIDPEMVVAAGYLGGEGSSLAAAATDASGNFYFAGQTASAMPGANFFGPVAGSGALVFVTKLSTDLSHTVFTDVFGGGGMQAGLTIQVDASGQAMVAGFTTSTNFPVVNSPPSNLPGGEGMFVAKLDPTGSVLMYSRLFAGSGQQIPITSAIDPQGNFFVAGSTTSPNLPIGTGQSFQSKLSGKSDGFILKLDPSGKPIAGTFFGGPQQDEVDALVLRYNSVFVAGTTNSPGLPTTADATQSNLSGGFDAYIGKFTPDLSQVQSLTYFGSPANESASALAVSSTGQSVLAGATNASTGFPQVLGSQVTYHGGNSDAFVAVFQSNPLSGGQSTLVQTILLGGSGTDSIAGIAPVVSPGGGYPALRLIGQTDSTFPSTLPGFSACTGAASIFKADLTLFTNSPPSMGCIGPGIVNSSVVAPDNSLIVVADVNQQVIPPITPFPYVGGTEGMFIEITGVTDHSRYDENVVMEQVSFGYTNAQLAYSPTGRVSINVPGLAANVGQPFGYLNVMIPGVGWVVPNLRFDVNNGINSLGTDFLLFDPTVPSQFVSNVNVQVSVDTAPRDTFDTTLPSVQFPVTPTVRNAEGTVAVNVPPPPPAANHTFTPAGDTYEHVLPRNDINVQAASHQCATASLANSLAYLASQNDNFKLPHPNNTGLKGDNTLVGQLDTATNRNVTSRTQGSGLYEQPELTGKFTYLKQNGLDKKLVQKYQGALYDSSGLNPISTDFTAQGVTTTNQGNVVTFDWLCNEIQQGEDVEINYEWNNGQKSGGHALRVFGCGKVHGAPYIWTLDDGVQTTAPPDPLHPGAPSGDPNDEKGLRNTRFFASDFGGSGFYLDNLNQPVFVAMSESLTPELKAAPGAPPSSFRDAITNGASYVRGYLTKAAIGAMFGLFQTLAGNTTEPAQALARDVSAGLPTDIDGTEVLFNGKAIPLFFVTPQQIDFQVPTDQPAGEVTIVVKQGSKQSAAFTIIISATPTPGIILIDPSIAGPNHGAVQNHDFSPNLPTNPAKPGEAVIVYVTGLGDTDVPVASGQPSPEPAANYLAKVTATIGGLPAEVQFAGLTPQSIALGQVNLVVPNLPPGDYPVEITADGAVSNAPLMSVGKP
jgi:uncharacterized protein (TIGR03437 family)